MTSRGTERNLDDANATTHHVSVDEGVVRRYASEVEVIIVLEPDTV